jgi:hypothetical protein
LPLLRFLIFLCLSPVSVVYSGGFLVVSLGAFHSNGFVCGFDPDSNLVAVLFLDLRLLDHLSTFVSTFMLFFNGFSRLSHLQKFQLNNYVGSFSHIAPFSSCA